jgi:hypothetical protein
MSDYIDVTRERYERLLSDRNWPDSQEKARRAVRALLNALNVAEGDAAETETPEEES